MNNFNFIVVEGRVTRDAEFKYTSKGKAVLKFSLANNYFKMKDGKKENAVNYFNVTVWDNLAEIMSKYLKKGTRIITGGRLTIDTFTNQNGEQKFSANILANNIDFINAGENGQNNSYNKTGYNGKKLANPA